MNTSSAKAYIAGIEKRHNMSAEHRSCGKHCPPLPAKDVRPGETVPVRDGDGGMSGKGGRGAGQSAKSNYRPGKNDHDGDEY